MSAKPAGTTVSHGNASITIYPWTHPASGARRWRFAWRENVGDAWRYKTHRTKDAAKNAAWNLLREREQGSLLSALPPARRRWLESLHREVAPADQEKVLQFIRTLRQSSDIAAAVARFRALKITKAGEETPHFANVRAVLDAVATHFAGRAVAEIHLPELEAWWRARTATGCGWKRKNDIRAALVTFWNWARKEQIIPNDPETIAQRLPETGREAHALRIFEGGEFSGVARDIAPDFRPWRGIL